MMTTLGLLLVPSVGAAWNVASDVSSRPVRSVRYDFMA